MGPWSIGVRPQCGSYYDDKAKNALNKAMQDEDIEWKFEVNLKQITSHHENFGTEQ